MRKSAAIIHPTVPKTIVRGLVKENHDDGTVTIVRGIELRGKPLTIEEIIQLEKEWNE